MVKIPIVFWNTGKKDARITFHEPKEKPSIEDLVPQKGLNFAKFCEKYHLEENDVLELFPSNPDEEKAEDTQDHSLEQTISIDRAGIERLSALLKISISIYIYERDKTSLQLLYEVSVE